MAQAHDPFKGQQTFTVSEAARYLEVGESLIHRAARSGALPRDPGGPKTLRTFRRAALDEFRRVHLPAQRGRTARPPKPSPASVASS